MATVIWTSGKKVDGTTDVIVQWQNHGWPYLQGVKDPRGQLVYMPGASLGLDVASHRSGPDHVNVIIVKVDGTLIDVPMYPEMKDC
jgi:hypothetical protein